MHTRSTVVHDFAGCVHRCVYSCLLWGGAFVAVFGPASVSSFGQQFELTAPQIGARSQANLSGGVLQVVASGGSVTQYTRDSRFDSDDRQWVGYFSRAADQVIRWPASNSGSMQIGAIRGGVVEYRFSQMSIVQTSAVPVGPAGNGSLGGGRVMERPVLPPIQSPGVSSIVPGGDSDFRTDGLPLDVAGQSLPGQSLLGNLQFSDLFNTLIQRPTQATAQMLRLASVNTQGAPVFLGRGGGMDLRFVNTAIATGTDWWVAPAGGGFVRFETYDRGRVFAVSANARGGLSMLPITQDARQLWRVSGAGRGRNRFVIESGAFAGSCLAQQSGQLVLQQISYLPTQWWSPYVAPAVATFQPFYRTLQTEVVANSQLPPAQLTLENTHRYALLVLLGDSRRGGEFEQIRIEPQSSATLTLERDAGATLVESVEVRGLGGWERQEFVTAVPPRAFYDLSVYEEHLQSIAIDATGKSPNPIEDVNYVPKSVGWLPLPAGQDLPAAGRLDIYPRAKAANNAGAVRRLDFEQWDSEQADGSPAADPLESILDKFNSTPRRKF